MKRLLLLVTVALSVIMSFAAKNKKKAQQPLKPMNEFVTELMGKMTLQEKIGQLNLLPSGNIQTGVSENSSVSEAIRNGGLGAILNLKGVENIQKVQQMAVEESRLGIPLIFGMDVIHGYETIFPIPLALACSWLRRKQLPTDYSGHIARWWTSALIRVGDVWQKVRAKTRSLAPALLRRWYEVIRANCQLSTLNFQLIT